MFSFIHATYTGYNILLILHGNLYIQSKDIESCFPIYR